MASNKQPEKRVRLTMEEKVQMHDFREKNPKMSFETIAKVFTEKFGKKVYSSVVERSYKLVKGRKEKGQSVDERDFEMKRQNKPSKRDFEAEMYSVINEKLLKSPMTFEMIQDIGEKLKTSPSYTNIKSIQGMKFSRNWWRSYKKRYGLAYGRRKGSKTYFPVGDIKAERERLLLEMKPFKKGKIKFYRV